MAAPAAIVLAVGLMQQDRVLLPIALDGASVSTKNLWAGWGSASRRPDHEGIAENRPRSKAYAPGLRGLGSAISKVVDRVLVITSTSRRDHVLQIRSALGLDDHLEMISPPVDANVSTLQSPDGVSGDEAAASLAGHYVA